MNKLDEIKSKYPLAVEVLSGLNFTTNSPTSQIDTTIKSNGLEVMFRLSTVMNQAKQDEISKMLADILNLIAKP